jgi:aspartate/methionine/tyrosine aminotransferase
MNAIKPFHVMAILAEAKRLEGLGRSIIHMEVGEPDFPTPQPIIEAGIQALQQGLTKYTAAQGITELRQAIADFYAKKFAVQIAPERILITPGASAGLQLVLAALVNAGEQVLLTDPGYPCNRHFVRLFEAEPVSIPVDASTGFQLTPKHIQNYWQAHTKAVLVASPANPTGTVASLAELSALHQAVQAKQGVLIVDEIYQGLSYDLSAVTALQVDATTIWIVNSFSKFFGMTGWRLGWIVVPEYAIEAATRLAQNMFLSASTPAQYAALAAFSPEALNIMEQNRQTLQQRRDFLLSALRDLGFNVQAAPQGAFYIYADCSAFTDDAFTWCQQVLQATGVAITPGLDFGQYRANQHVRFAYTATLAQLQQAIERLQQFLLTP